MKLSGYNRLPSFKYVFICVRSSLPRLCVCWVSDGRRDPARSSSAMPGTAGGYGYDRSGTSRCSVVCKSYHFETTLYLLSGAIFSLDK